jgi:hypothetical protein
MSIGKIPPGLNVAGNVLPPRKPPSGGTVASGGGEFDPNDPIQPNQPDDVKKRRIDEISEDSQEVHDAIAAIVLQPVLAQVNWLYDGNLVHLGSFETPKLESIRDYLRTNMDEAVRAGSVTYGGNFGSGENPEERRRRSLQVILEEIEKLLEERKKEKK